MNLNTVPLTKSTIRAHTNQIFESFGPRLNESVTSNSSPDHGNDSVPYVRSDQARYATLYERDDISDKSLASDVQDSITESYLVRCDQMQENLETEIDHRPPTQKTPPLCVVQWNANGLRTAAAAL